MVTNFAADSDFPANILTFSLEPGAPGGAAIDPATGVFTWTPAANQSPGTYPVTVRVTDNGVPSWSDRGSFNIVVVGMPVIESIVAAGGNPTITWGAVGGRNYRVQFKSDLNILSWSDLPGDVTGSTASKTDTTISGAERFYRIVLLP